VYTVLAATSATLRKMLLDAMTSNIGPTAFFTAAMSVSLETPKEMTTASRQGLSLWLYRVGRDENRLNDPPEVRTLASGQIDVLPPPLPVRLHYLLTPISTSNPDTEQRILGRAMQLFHTHPIVSAPFLQGELAGSNAQLHVHLEALGLDEMSRVWEALGGSYQLSVSYEVTLARIDVDADPLPISLVESVHPSEALIVERLSA
jgi:hypothetical protein